ncbi:unnamed protein product [Eruca vesicaria subsp. sativa]|uniref:Uncharacterized protein n=1 Tax=Eruca vesicaria subsp. sativa TaxID=29727 RepID=A0ABC8LXI9_ERUVS|nr:unnamed protein product [Eruca vesicaria subsp. sativa]
MSEEINGGSSLREVQNKEIDFSTRFQRTEFGVDNDDLNIADADVDGYDISNVNNHHRDREVDSIMMRRQRSSAAILQLIQITHDMINSDEDLGQLFRNIGDNDTIRRQGTLPERKEAVENLLTVKVCEPLQCSVCLKTLRKEVKLKRCHVSTSFKYCVYYRGLSFTVLVLCADLYYLLMRS